MTDHTDLCEKEPPKSAIILYTLLIFAGLHLIHHPLSPLSSSEAFQALTARELMGGDQILLHQGHDAFLSQYPLYSMTLSLLGRIFTLNEYTCRIPEIIAILGMALLAGYTTARSAGHRGGLTAASVVLVGFGPAFSFFDGNALLAGFLISSAWIIWYRASRLWNAPWLLIWLLSLLPVFTAIWAIGFKSIILFYLPLIFMRRPLKARKRLSQIQHVIALAFYIILFLALKRDIFGEGFVVELQSLPEVGFIAFTCVSLLLFTPWIFIGWPVFCMAFQGVEKTPVFSQYIRTILITTSVFCLFFSRNIALMASLLPIFAIGSGIHYDIFMRRYYLQVRYVGRCIIWSLSLLFAYSTIQLALSYFSADWSATTLTKASIALGITAIALIISLIMFILKRKFMIYSCRLAIITACFIISAYTTKTVFTESFDYAKESKSLVEKLETYETIHLLVKRDCYQEAFYLKRKVAKIKSAEQLPDHDVVYVLTETEAPILETRDWTVISEANFPEGKLSLWHGKKRPELTPQPQQ